MIIKNDFEWLAGLTQAVVDKARIASRQSVAERQGANQTGGTLITPGGRYPAFWIRDYAMSLDGALLRYLRNVIDRMSRYKLTLIDKYDPDMYPSKIAQADRVFIFQGRRKHEEKNYNFP